MPVYQIKLSSPATFSSEAGWSFVKNPDVLGAELNPEPDFNLDFPGTSAWSLLGGTLTITGGQCTLDSGGADIAPTIPLEAVKTYRFTVNIVYVTTADFIID